jgi:hypothetical protein
VLALLWDGSNLYAGGAEFTIAGGNPANNIAKWDGNSWSALGSGIEPVVSVPTTSVDAFAWDGSNLYVGGHFATAGGNPANNIAKWDGSSWSALGSGVENNVSASSYSVIRTLLWNDSNLYAGGEFTIAGGNPANNIAKWDGSSWSALDSGMSGRVEALVWDGSNHYAGGTFVTAGGNTVNNVAKWDGSSWSALGSGLDGAYSSVQALAWNGGNLYVAGDFSIAGSKPSHNIALWRDITTSCDFLPVVVGP